jgi:hypothetical protein
LHFSFTYYIFFYLGTIETQNTIPSEVIHEREQVKKRICLVGNVSQNESIIEAAKEFNVPVLHSETAVELIADTKWQTYFIVNDFEGRTFEVLSKSKHK